MGTDGTPPRRTFRFPIHPPMWLGSIPMVIYRSELSRSRTSIHGGLRRGAAAAAVGAVLVLSTGVSASQADDDSTDRTKPARVAADGSLAPVNGLLKGLLGGSGGYAVTASPEPSPSAPTTTAPTTTAPISTQPPAPAPASTATASPVPTTAPTSAVPAPQGAAPQSTVPPSTAPAPLSPSPATGAGSPAGGQPNGQPGAPAAGTQDAGQDSGPTADQSTQDPRSANASPVSGPRRPGNAPASREKMASATEAEAAAEPAKVWLGVGLVGTAGAAGLLFARIRRI